MVNQVVQKNLAEASWRVWSIWYCRGNPAEVSWCVPPEINRLLCSEKLFIL